MGWRLALSLVTLRAEFDAAFPGRSKRSDGTIGDPAHRSRPSRHNPNRHDDVTALDITHDPASGCDVHAEARRIAEDPHPELAYIISNRQIASRPDFNWRPYSGSNPHTAHAHFAVGVGPDSDPRPPYDSRQPWGVYVYRRRYQMVIYTKRGTPDALAALAAHAAAPKGVVTQDLDEAKAALDRGEKVYAVGGPAARDLPGATEVVGATAIETGRKVYDLARSGW